MSVRKYHYSREEIVNALRAFAAEHGEQTSVRTFVRETGIPNGQIYEIFGSWRTLREEAGLPPRSRSMPWFSDEEIMETLHRITCQLGRLPIMTEFSRMAGMNWNIMNRRIGNREAILERYRQWLAERRRDILDGEHPWTMDDLLRGGPAAAGEAEPGETRVTNVTSDSGQPERDVAWLRRKWQSLRVGFELRSKDFEGRRPDLCDVLVVLEHDWKTCPVRVLELRAVCPEVG